MTANSDVKAPSHLLTDYVEIASLCVQSATGLVTNAAALRRMLMTSSSTAVQRRNRNDRTIHARRNLLLINLVVSNMLILLFYCPISAVWLYTYEWHMGEWLCKGVKTCFLFSFCLHSNMVACIALDRVSFVRKLVKPNQNLSSALTDNNTLYLVIGGWLMAAVCSVPQWLVFETITLINGPFTQCTNIWEKAFFINASTEAHRFADYTNLGGNTLYHIWHLISVFGLPFGVIVVSYGLLQAELKGYVSQPFTTVSCSNSGGPATSAVAVDSDLDPPRLRAATITCSVNSQTQLLPLADTRSRRDYGSTPNELTRSVAVVSEVERNAQQLTTDRRQTEIAVQTVPNWRLTMQKRASRTTTAIIVCYSLCWLPYSIAVGTGLISVQFRRDVLDKYTHWLTAVSVLNCVIGPFFYRFGDVD